MTERPHQRGGRQLVSVDVGGAEHPLQSGCAITILHAPGRRLAKLIRADGTFVGYDNARLFAADERPISDLDDLRRLLEQLHGCPEQCIVRGSLLNGPHASNIRRLIHPDEKTGDQPTLYEVPRRWISIDVDGIPLPPEIDATDIAACATVAISHLPTEFHGAACIAFPTASHGIKPGCRLRLWFWLDGVATRKTLQAWFFDTPGVDLALFRPAQINYTAAPVIAPGATCPVIGRRAVLLGGPVPVRPLPAPPREASAPPVSDKNGPVPSSGHCSDRYRDAALIAIKGRLLAVSEGHRHHTLVAEACALLKLGCLSDGYINDFIHDAAVALNSRGQRQIDSQEIDELLDWARTRTAGRIAT